MLTIYKASAGSGKTFNLAYRYIKMLLAVKGEDGVYRLDIPKYTHRPSRPRAHSHILAITFTNKATAEMKGRIIKELDLLGAVPSDGEKDSDYGPMLVGELGCTRPELAAAATRALHSLLNDYGAFNVSTIDSFFQMILRSFAREIDRQGDYRLELDSDNAVGAAVAMLFDDVNEERVGAGSANPLVEWVRGLAAERFVAGKDFNPFNHSSSLFADVTRYLKRTFDETFESKATQIHEFIERPGAIADFTEKLGHLSAEAGARLVALADGVRDALAAEGFSLNNVYSHLAGMIDATGRDGFETKFTDALKRAMKKESGYMYCLYMHDPSFMKGGYYTKKANVSAAVDEAIYRWFDASSDLLPLIVVYSHMAASLGTLRALSHISDYINRFRQENNLILMADTNSLLGSIISESETPFIYERVGVELHNFLIDEFQDTSRMQWDNLRPLLSSSMDTNGDSDSLIIGDVKQSIYRWRGGDSSLLDSRVETEDFAGRNEVLGAGEGENTNYRSAHGIVRFNNSLFKLLAAEQDIPGYAGVAQELPPKTAPLTSWVRFTDLCGEDAEAFLRERLTDEEFEFCAASGSMTATAAILLTGHEIMAEHDRGYRWKDIIVLCRRNNEGSRVAEVFAERFPEIKLVSDEALMVGAAPSVRLIVSILQVLDMTLSGGTPAGDGDDADDSGVSPASDPTRLMIDRFEYFLAHGSTVDRALSDALGIALDNGVADGRGGSLASDISAIRADHPANLPALVESVIAHKIPVHQRMAELPYINAFVDAVNEFTVNYNPTLHAFLEYWERVSKTLAIGAPDGVDAVSIMTIHKAKGLEKDCVHIPILDWAFAARPDGGWFSLEHMDGYDPDDCPPLLHLSYKAEMSSRLSPFAAAVADQVRKDTADNLNVAYVAFTRARRELHAFMQPSADVCLNDSLERAFSTRGPGGSPLFIDMAEYADGNGGFEMGQPTSREDAPAAAADSCRRLDRGRAVNPSPRAASGFSVAFTALNKQLSQVDDLVMDPAGGLDVDLGDEAPRLPLADAGSAPSDTLLCSLDEATRRGNDMHAVLALMDTAADLDAALFRITHNMPPEVEQDYRRVLGQAFESAGDYRDLWFGPAERVLCEQTIYSAANGRNYRPDRVVWTAAGTVDIVDYKFTGEQSDEHFGQVRAYMGMLREMGIANVRGFIWYLNRCEIVPVRL